MVKWGSKWSKNDVISKCKNFHSLITTYRALTRNITDYRKTPMSSSIQLIATMHKKVSRPTISCIRILSAYNHDCFCGLLFDVWCHDELTEFYFNWPSLDWSDTVVWAAVACRAGGGGRGRLERKRPLFIGCKTVFAFRFRVWIPSFLIEVGRGTWRRTSNNI